MLDSLGSTLSRETIDSFYTRYGKNPQVDSISFSQGVQCLEAEICRPTNERKKVDFSHEDDTSPSTPSGLSSAGGALALDALDFSGPGKLQPHQEPQLDTTNKPLPPTTYSAEPSQITAEYLVSGPPVRPGLTMTHHPASTDSDDPDESGSGSSNGSGSGDDSRERVINVKNCPLCHRPRMNSKAEMDIVTHLAICASKDWNRVDKIVVGNFVTASQAQRKWYTKIVSKISSGDYRLGAVRFSLLSFGCCADEGLQNSANIIVQNRMTGQLEEEKMQVYVRLGIRLLYKVCWESSRAVLFADCVSRVPRVGWRVVEVRSPTNCHSGH
jgi:phosphatidylserine decarboxylase